MATLTDNITADQTDIAVSGDVSAALTKVGYRIDDEIVTLRAFGQTDPWSPRYGTDRTRWVVSRGAEGTTPASHLADASIVAVEEAVTSSTTLVPPAPFAGEGGGSGVTVDNGTDPPAEVSTIVAPGADVSVSGTATFRKWTFEDEDVDASLEVTAVGHAWADTSVESTGGGSARANTLVSSGASGSAKANCFVDSNGADPAELRNEVGAWGAGLATGNLVANSPAGTSGISLEADATSVRMAFNGATPIVRPEIPATPTEQDIADVLVALGLVTQAAP